jgi:hypothetical protein
VVLEWQPRTLARFAKQVARETAADRTDQSGGHDVTSGFATSGLGSRVGEHSSAQRKQLQSMQKDKRESNSLDSPRFSTNPVFNPGQINGPVTMYPSAADGLPNQAA